MNSQDNKPNDIPSAHEQPTEEQPFTLKETRDYALPVKRNDLKKGSRRARHAASSKNSSAAEDQSADGFVFAKPVKEKAKMKGWIKTLIVIVAVLLALILAGAVAMMIVREVGRSQMQDYTDVEIIIPTEETNGFENTDVQNAGKTIVHNGHTYALNEHIITVTFVGNDYDDSEPDSPPMSDAIFIAALNPDSKKISVISVSRDTMCDVNVYSDRGVFVKTENKQLSFAYSYGNDVVTGGENTATSVSRIFFGLPLKNYFSMDLNALIDLNDAIGGVTLTSSMDFVSRIDGSQIYAGDVVTLYGKDAEIYVRYRDKEQLASNSTRMQRQQEYIQAFMQSFVPAAKSDISVVSDLYNVIVENSETSLTLPKITYLAGTALSMLGDSSDIEYINLPGDFTAGQFAEFHVDDNAVLETMLDVFYNQVG